MLFYFSILHLQIRTKEMKYIIAFIFGVSLNFLSAQSLSTEINDFYKNVITEEGLVNYGVVDKDILSKVTRQISTADLTAFSKEEQVAFMINAYNVIVIDKISKQYPDFKSVNNDSGFFKDPNQIAGKKMGLDALEKEILKLYPSGHIHMALICGAVSCPPFPKQAFEGSNLENQLSNHSKVALKSDQIVNSENKISSIFQWYGKDFEPTVKQWISDNGGPALSKLSFQKYDWSLNDVSTNEPAIADTEDDEDLRYFASNLYSKGSYEIGSFSNYYTQRIKTNTTDQQQDFFTSTTTFLYGINKRLNVGLDVRYRSTQAGNPDRLSTFGGLFVFKEELETDIEGNTLKSARVGFSALGLRIKYQPIKTIQNLTFQHVINIPLIGFSEAGFLDWESPYIISDAFYDQLIGSKGSVFFSGGLHLENMNSAFFRSGDGYTQISTPFTVIYSYFPDAKTTFYVLGNIAPKWGFNVSNGGTESQAIWDPYGQVGLGFKYFLWDNFQVELLYTKFFTNIDGFSADTFNFGTRFYAW